MIDDDYLPRIVYDAPLFSPLRAWQGFLWWALYARGKRYYGGPLYFIRFHRRPVAWRFWADKQIRKGRLHET